MTATSVSPVSPPNPPQPSTSWKDRTPSERLAAAQDFLRGAKPSFADLRGLAAALKDSDKRFTHARRLLVRALRHEDYKTQDEKTRRKVLQQLALCTYKDDDLPAERRSKRALDWLQEIATLDELKDQESLCLVGAILKRQWETTGRIPYLKQSLVFYRRGHDAAGPTTSDYDGYGAINAAFVSDLIALEEAKTSPGAAVVDEHVNLARQLRTEIVTLLPSKAEAAGDADWVWWLWATIAEAHLGLMSYDDATAALKEGLTRTKAYEWQKESTARQLAYLAHTIALGNAAEGAKAHDVIRSGFSLSPDACEAIVFGRIGLALSGGGFRASLFHIGVLARLAELDLLRHLEVLSCVSGGSIIGAYYFLELRTRMQELPDRDMTQAEYAAIVKRVEKRFLEGVQTNLRSSIATDLWSDLRMIFDPRYSRSTRIGDLYQSRLFDQVPLPVVDEDKPAPKRPEWVSDLPFTPKGDDPQFNPKLHNWRRASKVPMLVLNATTLNTGHNWQFTATWMGEAATTIDNRIDGNDYLRRMYYSEAPGDYKHKGVRLGHAVAASACVPGLFPAVKLPNLYEGHPVVRLVDGGVHDNQGIAALLDQDCSVILVSDASGQMLSVENPPGGVIGGPARSNSVLQARVRLAQYRELDTRRRSGALRELMWVHLREELEPNAVDWVDCQDRFSREDEGLPEKPDNPRTGYGVNRKIQDALARLRTDLDSFSNIEAHALMCSAYLMTTSALRKGTSIFSNRPERPDSWGFMNIAEDLKSPPGEFRAGVPLALRVGERLPFKVWRVSPVLSGFITAALIALGLAGVYAVSSFAIARGWIEATARLTPIAAVLGLAAVIAVLAAIRWGLQTYGRVGEVVERGTLGVLTMLLFVPMWIHRKIFDPIFLDRGRYDSSQ